jgi:hypothetical protein
MRSAAHIVFIPSVHRRSRRPNSTQLLHPSPIHSYRRLSVFTLFCINTRTPNPAAANVAATRSIAQTLDSRPVLDDDVYLLLHVVALLLWQTYVGLWIWTSSSKDWEKRTHFNRNSPCVTRDLVKFRVSTLNDFVKTFKFFPQIHFLNLNLLYFSLYFKLIDIGL